MIQTHVVTEGESGERADVVVAHAAHAPRSVVADAVKRGTVTLNGRVIKASTPVESGDELRFSLEFPEPLSAVPEQLPLDVVFEDETLLVVNKPAGMVTHPAHGSPHGTLVNALLAHTGTLPGEALRAGLVHRLDRDTSGLLLVAKTEAALATLGRAMQARYIEREYVGLVAGNPPQDAGTLDGAIGRDDRHRLRHAIRADGRPAVTHFAVRERMTQAAELTFRLETGRTHQIRVHMAAYGYPIVNDPLYGRPDTQLALPGQALHAWKLGFRHPVTRERLSFEAQPPADYADARDLLRKPL
jgi:23S rRNA pseudouridine1911/1915/1917 synthase